MAVSAHFWESTKQNIEISKQSELVLEKGENKFGTSDEFRDPSSDGVAMEEEHISQRKKIHRHFSVHVPEPKLMSKINSRVFTLITVLKTLPDFSAMFLSL